MKSELHTWNSNMSDKVGKCIAVVILLMTGHHEAYSQEHSVGTSWSLSGIGVDYRYVTGTDTFIWVQAKADMMDIFLGKTGVPGASASFSWNSIFAEKQPSAGCSMRFYAGPGIIAGYARDHKTGHGPIFGLLGRVGVRLTYERNAEICIGLAPVLGMHVRTDSAQMSMKCYRYGLVQAIMPEISINYRF